MDGRGGRPGLARVGGRSRPDPDAPLRRRPGPGHRRRCPSRRPRRAVRRTGRSVPRPSVASSRGQRLACETQLACDAPLTRRSRTNGPGRGLFLRRRRPDSPRLAALGAGMPEAPARRLRLRDLGRGAAHAVLRAGPHRREALVLRSDGTRIRLRQRRRRRARRARRIRRAGRRQGGCAPDRNRIDDDPPHVLQGRAQAAARLLDRRRRLRGRREPATALAPGGRARSAARLR